MTSEAPAYGLWWLVAVNAALFILFAFSFFKPRTARDWRTLGAFSAFVVALFVEMYGFPLTLYLLAGGLGRRFPALDPLSHDAGHLWPVLFGWSRDPHWSPFHLLSFVLIGGGFMLIASAWRVLHEAQRQGELATTGPYARIRHPQYAGFGLIIVGFFLQWPTLVTALMLPVLLVMYWRLARREEREVEAVFGDRYQRYAERVPAFLPRLGRPPQGRATRGGVAVTSMPAGLGRSGRRTATRTPRALGWPTVVSGEVARGMSRGPPATKHPATEEDQTDGTQGGTEQWANS